MKGRRQALSGWDVMGSSTIDVCPCMNIASNQRGSRHTFAGEIQIQYPGILSMLDRTCQRCTSSGRVSFAFQAGKGRPLPARYGPAKIRIQIGH